MTQYRYTAYPAPTTYLSTELDALPNAGVVLGAAIDNSVNRHKYMRLMTDLASQDLSTQPGPAIRLRMIESLDGAKFEDNDTQAYSITFPLAATNAAHTRAGILEIPPDEFKLAFVNETGAALGATLNTLKYVTYTDEDDTV